MQPTTSFEDRDCFANKRYRIMETFCLSKVIGMKPEYIHDVVLLFLL